MITPSTYTTGNSATVEQTIDRVVALFPQKFTQNINKNDILVIFKDAETTNKSDIVTIKLVRGYEEAMTGKKIIMIIHKATWLNGEDHERALAIYEQLLKITWDQEKRKYRIGKTDLNTFKELVLDFGVNGEKFREFMVSKTTV